MNRLIALLCLSLPLFSQSKGEFQTAPRGLKINEIQVLGTHNSYQIPPDPSILKTVEPILTKMMSGMTARMTPEQLALFNEEHPNPITLSEALAYSHPDIKTQLDAGVRSLGIDINPDPEGGRFLDPAAYRLLRSQGVTDLAPHDTTDLDKPGFKVLHIPDIDFRSNCPTLKLCLTQIRDWSDQHPKHVPLFILIEAKTQALPILPGSVKAAPFDAKAFDAFDQEVLSVLGRKRLVTPDDLRGDYPTLEQAALAKNWPTLDSARGKVLFLMITATGPADILGYLNGHPSLKGRVAFLRANPGDEHAAFLMFDNAVARTKEITEYAKKGYLIRTRSDIETYEAKANDMSRANVAFGSGAQIVTTDFFRPGNVYKTPYFVRLPGGGVARCNPQTAPACRP